MKSWFRTALCLCTMLSVTFVCTFCFAQTYDRNNSPSSQNWANAPQNWQNSSQNWKNSSQNWQNSANQYDNTNGIYDSNGNRTGYSVPTANGGINYFNNDGSRRGYRPGN